MSLEVKFDKRTLRQRCSAHVREAIIAGSLEPGAHIVEMRLAEELNVSRGTLREALRPLEAEGLLVGDGKGHLSVRRMTAKEIAEVFQVRGALESLAASLLAARPDREAVAARLRDALMPLKDESLSFAAQIEADLGFHELICRLTGNATLTKSWRQLSGQIKMMIIAVGPARASARMRYADHAVIADAIASGDLDRVREVLAGHLNEFSLRYLDDAPLD
ncbi:GntR family transcriptional regulator [Salinibacterium sp. PAMC 21357]|uniref:GntR family transcriptional regulator n=1 Tax=Salinibacterium sp. PAMC 21357 TaxID=1112215 RepID=UPI000584B605|nr:GntR family transcriptional regulator [Salinibacterium sp. PAMC 21357]